MTEINPRVTVGGDIVGLKVHEAGPEQFYIIGHLAEGKGSSEWRAVAGIFSSAEQAASQLSIIRANNRAEMDQMRRAGNHIPEIGDES